ncbi:MAG TPA: class I SAM-dependent methyltransferase [Aliidongia sp.]|uniref:class I SAM-dependent methyltransferase n=1 Tax=Aliidongia sp. TaxID=1914230 RepID=UPI002DDD17E7|nr:class I SAM-dependent methyltransferase [Aliidongia sp.]HEV2676093.1 class I SAM-dependent methyltransferase [Aliidongia sp.]
MTQRRTLRMPREYFEDLYVGSPDPWGFVTSDYERQKYDATMVAIGGGHRNALEIGCSIGVFTQRLAANCRQLLAVDIAETALDAARRRCGDLPNVEFRRMQFPDELPDDRFDLVVLSEVGYYWTLPDLDLFLAWLRDALTPDGVFVLVHWTGGTDYPLTGDQVHDHVVTATHDFLHATHKAYNDFYRLDVLAGGDRPADGA